jgi:hypothetical protein
VTSSLALQTHSEASEKETCVRLGHLKKISAKILTCPHLILQSMPKLLGQKQCKSSHLYSLQTYRTKESTHNDKVENLTGEMRGTGDVSLWDGLSYQNINRS